MHIEPTATNRAPAAGKQLGFDRIKQIILPDFYPSVTIDTHIIMPDHVHAIIYLNNDVLEKGPAGRPAPAYSLSDIIALYKSVTTKKYIDAVKNDQWKPFYKKIWQRSFHDLIIRNEHALNKIRA